MDDDGLAFRVPLGPGERETVAWARSLIRAGSAGGAPPAFGSSEWQRLADGDRRKVAAVVIAALCWWDESRPAELRRRLAEDVEGASRVQGVLVAEATAELGAAVRRMANAPDRGELTRRRAELTEVVMVEGRPVSRPRTRPDFPGRRAGGSAPEGVSNGRSDAVVGDQASSSENAPSPARRTEARASASSGLGR